MRRLAWVLVIAGCFDPVYPAGVFCSPQGTCPPGQACDSTNHCVDVAGSGGGGGGGGAGGAGGGVVGQCTPQASTCDPVCNTGCGGDQRCDVGNSPNTGICIAPGSAGAGQSCSFQGTHDTCAPPTTCLGDHVCYRLCYTDQNCSASCCSIAVTVGGQDSGFAVCVNPVNCDPTSTSSGAPCGSGEGCYLQPCGNATHLTECAGAGSTPTGGSCQFNNDCAPGNKCIGNACIRVCQLASGNCPTGTCQPVHIDTNTSSDVFGVCR